MPAGGGRRLNQVSSGVLTDQGHAFDFVICTALQSVQVDACGGRTASVVVTVPSDLVVPLPHHPVNQGADSFSGHIVDHQGRPALGRQVELDGGHLVFLTIEGIMRKPMNERAQIFAQQIGIGLLTTLMIFVFYNDIVRLLS